MEDLKNKMEDLFKKKIKSTKRKIKERQNNIFLLEIRGASNSATEIPKLKKEIIELMGALKCCQELMKQTQKKSFTLETI